MSTPINREVKLSQDDIATTRRHITKEANPNRIEHISSPMEGVSEDTNVDAMIPGLSEEMERIKRREEEEL
ncbi:hypothetical protein VNO78_22919 [Psophocarpus tetragonolobus]|uniref:Uncharacterized protein n=1 Tax=Psophocarpus tetragonolobus TaxID=3891 RepID=A0AAN9S2E6_PSOTE